MTNKRTNRGWAKSALLSCLLASLPAAAQVVNDGATNTLSNVTNTFTGDVTVGTNGSFTLLVLSDNALLTNSANGVIGRNATANSNQVRLISASARWLMGVELNIGLSGSGNRLVVSNGGVVQSPGASYIGKNASSANNEAIVTGPGSVWASDSGLAVGNSGGNNRLVVTNGGSVRNFAGFIGLLSGDNEARVTGAGSSWTNLDTLHVGRFASASRNRLVVSNAGVVFSALGVIVGTAAGSTNNRVTVDGGTLRAGNASGTAALDVRRGTNVLNAGLIDVDQLLLTNTLGVFDFNGGTLVTRGAFINNGLRFNVGNPGGTPATWDVRAGVSDHVLAGQLFLGNNTTLNQLLVTNGALLASDDVFIGFNTGGHSNIALISGTGSRWAVDTSLGDAYLQVGYVGSFNRLVISNGGWVASTFAEIGRFSVGNNQAVVTGAGSVWTNREEFRVGVNGTGNSLVVTNGGTVVSSNTYLGFSADSSSNDVVVTDAGSVLSNRATLFVGYGGVGGNRLLVSNGGVVRDNNGEIGLNFNTISSDNMAVVTGAGSLWSNNDHLFVGVFGARNQLVVSNGGLVVNNDGVLGFSASSSSNTAMITGTGSIWSNPSSLVVGESGSGNRLEVSNGGVVWANFGRIGLDSTSSNNVAVVTGSGSIWSHTSLLDIGFSGAGNHLVVSNGGVVFAQAAVRVGFNANSTNNRVVVDGGTLRTTNAAGSSVLDVRRGTSVLNAGLVEADRLLATNTAGRFELNGGTLSVKSSTVANGQAFLVGNGVSAATLNLTGNGIHSFANVLAVFANGALIGNGTITGGVGVEAGGTLAPGVPQGGIGKLVVNGSAVLAGAVIMEISKNGATLTNDQIQVIAALTYGGSLTVSNLGPTALAIGDRFPLFSANSYAGAFSVVSLPSLPAGLNWTNKLLVDGSIEVVAGPKFTSVTLSGTNLIFTGTGGTPNAPYAVLTSTNVALPLSNWVSIATNLFGPAGEFSFTNGISPGIPQRFFRLRTP